MADEKKPADAQQQPNQAKAPAVKIVRFLKLYRAYNAGETAGFSPAFADQLIKDGIAAASDRKDPKSVKPNTSRSEEE